MTLGTWLKRQPVTGRYLPVHFVYMMPDVAGLVDRWQAWKLDDYVVWSVSGGSIAFAPRDWSAELAADDPARGE